jgi:hypothetical protein
MIRLFAEELEHDQGTFPMVENAGCVWMIKQRAANKKANLTVGLLLERRGN